MAAVSPVKEVPPPLQDIPTAKERKYDRQLRLWGAAGQVALEESHILLINNGPGVTGVETLKNVVLPGVGQFTILDSALVAPEDLGVNFFLEDSSLGRFRAQETVKYLMELNPDVKGHAITEPLETWAVRDKIFRPYNLVLVAAPIDPTIFALITRRLHALHIPAFYIHSLGFYSHFSLHLPGAFPIVDTHPDPTATTDLRLTTPWPELVEFSRKKTSNMDQMSENEFAHIPYVCLLLRYLEQWQQQNGKIPESYKEKKAFRDSVRSGSASEENFDEACAAVLKSLNPPTVPSSVQEIFSAPESKGLGPNGTRPNELPFWVIARAVSEFYNKHGELPLPGAVPDMKAESDTYIELQNIYKQKARKDAAEVLSTVRELEEKTGQYPVLTISEAEVENFCKNAAHISLVRGRPFIIPVPGAKITFGDRAKSLCNELTNPESLVGLYIAFCAWDLFSASHDLEPATSGGAALRAAGIHDYEEDAEKLIGIAHTIVDCIINEAGTRIDDPEYTNVKTAVGNYARELARAGGGELHNVASLSGGLIAQEVIKVITKQYVPIDNTCVFDAITSRSWVGQV